MNPDHALTPSSLPSTPNAVSKNPSTSPLGAALTSLSATPIAGVPIVRYVSREDPLLNVQAARLAVGRDDRVYLWSGKYVLRVNRDGTEKLGGEVPDALTAATANSDGVIATGNGHFNHSVNLWSPKFERLGAVSDFLNNDKVQYFAPSDVQAGAGGDFYGLDENRNRILRVAAPGRLATTYPLAGMGEDLTGKIARFRVWEGGKQFYVLCPSGILRVLDFDGKPLWTLKPKVGGNPWDGWRGGFDVDEAGRLLVLADAGDVVKVFGPDGAPAGELKLRMGERKGRVSDLRVFGDDILVRRPDPVELFQVYDRKTGELRRVVRADVEKLTFTLSSEVWTAGDDIPLRIGVEAEGRTVRPAWRPWWRPLGGVEFRELPVRDSAVAVPTDAGGFYQLRVTPAGDGASDEYTVETVVEVRRPGAKGSASVFTPLNRVYYGQGERVPVSVLVRIAAGDALPDRVAVRLLDGDRVLAEGVVHPEAGKPSLLALPPSLTDALRPGEYLLTAEAPGLTPAPQPLVIGPGLRRRPTFHIVQHGDYHDPFPKAAPFDAPEAVAAHLARSRKLGVNLFVDRLGSPGTLAAVGQTLTPPGLAERAKADPRSPAPEKATFEGPIRRTVGAYGSFGIEEQAILLYMDAGLPLGTGFDARKPEQFADAITKVTTGLDGYPAFRGWSWAANWWIGKLGAQAAATPEQKTAYEAALKRTKETGAWDPVLDQVSDVVLGHAVVAEQQFRTALRKVGPGKLSDMTGPYRAVGVDPPITFRNADEVDLHYQSEQIQPPQVTPHNVDFYKRPGKPAWGHPELWNDDGTGGMIYPTALQMVMRGADGVGWSGNAPDWPVGQDDPRSGGPGAASVYRNLDGLLRQYGPWLVTTENADRTAIVVSSRMLRIDDWSKLGGWYFARLFEAYNGCLYAHRPASFVFAEDATPEVLKKYRAVLVVGQRVELDPPLAEALKAASAGGTAVFCDETCRPDVVKDFTPLGIAFDKLLHDPSAWQDDSAYARFPVYFTEYAAVLRKILGAAVPPVAGCDEPGVMLTERRSGDARFVWAVNNVPTGLDPGLAWRVGLLMSQRAPLVTKLTLDAAGRTVYDVFALRQTAGSDVEADLRTMPARLYAILPAPIQGVTVRGPSVVPAGRAFAWEAAVVDANGKPFQARLPLRVRLLGSDGAIVAEDYTSAGGEGASGSFVLPLNMPPGPASIEVVDLIAGKLARLAVKVQTQDHPALIPSADAPADEAARLPADATAAGNEAGALPPAEAAFGPHFRSVAVSADGSTVLLGAFNWDQNLYALDARTGEALARPGRSSLRLRPGRRGRRVRRSGLRPLHRRGLSPLPADRGRSVRAAVRAVRPAEAGHGLGRRRPHARPDRPLCRRPGRVVGGVFRRPGAGGLGPRRQAPLEPRLVEDGAEARAAAGAGRRNPTGPGRRHGDGVQGSFRGEIVERGPGQDRGTPGRGGQRGRAHRRPARQRQGGPRLRAARRQGRRRPSRVRRRGRPLVRRRRRGHDRGEAAPVVFRRRNPGVGFHRGRHPPRPGVSPDGRRVCVGSEIGTLYVLDEHGAVLAAPDLGALPAAAWLSSGGLVAATWAGTVVGYDGNLKERWRSLPAPTVTDARPRLLAADPTPTTRRAGWGNAEATPAPLTPNLLAETKALITAVSDPPAPGDPRPWQNKIELLTDGKPDAPPQPWLTWTDVNYIDSGWWAKLALQVDTFHTQLRVTGVTFVEDPAHPESWLRDMRLQWWDAAADRWRDGPYLLSDAAVHTHRFEAPIEAARFRFVSTGGGTWPGGNLRLGELVFHGEALGASHPDALAKRPVAVLFDEREDDLSCLKNSGRPVAFQPTGAYSGGKCLALTGEGIALPTWRPPFGHAVPNWDFEIAENPEPGQYRYLQFVWKAASDKTTGMSLLLGRAWPGGGVAVVAGKYDWKEGVIATQQASDRPPAEWQVVRVDLWALTKRPFRVQAIGLAATGDGRSSTRSFWAAPCPNWTGPHGPGEACGWRLGHFKETLSGTSFDDLCPRPPRHS